MTSTIRYASNSVAWWLHDTVVHPLTGALGLFGRAIRSPRIMGLSHHIHNATAPSNDAWGDWAEAAHRAACNEGGAGPLVPRPSWQPMTEDEPCYACGDPGWKGKLVRDGGDVFYPRHRGLDPDRDCPLSGQRCDGSYYTQDIQKRFWNGQRHLFKGYLSDDRVCERELPRTNELAGPRAQHEAELEASAKASAEAALVEKVAALVVELLQAKKPAAKRGKR